MKNLFIGIMSGTSRDSLDACLVDFTDHFQIISTETLSFSANYKTSTEITEINTEITNKSIEIIKNLLNKADIKESEIFGVGFSGQTISHNEEHSLQAGDPKKIARSTGINVFSDFRNKNIAEGGRGAPLIPDFHQYIFSETEKRKLIVNIGHGLNFNNVKSIANISFISELNIGHFLIGEAIFMSLEEAIKKMKKIINS